MGLRSSARGVAVRWLAFGHEDEMIVEHPYAQMQCMLDDPSGYRNYCSAEYLDAFADEAVDKFCARARDMILPSPSQHVIIPQAGAIARGASDYSIPWRKASWCAHTFGLWEDPGDDERGRRWTHNLCAELKPWASGAVYLNFIGDEGENRVVAGFGRENYQRLAPVKAQYDPENIFHLNHNIKSTSLTPANGALHRTASTLRSEAAVELRGYSETTP